VPTPCRQSAELLELRDDPAAPVASDGRQRLIANDIFSSVLGKLILFNDVGDLILIRSDRRGEGGSANASRSCRPPRPEQGDFCRPPSRCYT